MATDTQAMGLLIRMMPLMLREYALRIEPTQFFADSGYATSILEAAQTASEPRLKGYAEQLRERMASLSVGPPGALRSAATSHPPAEAPTAPPGGASTPGEPAPVPPRKYLRTLR